MDMGYLIPSTFVMAGRGPPVLNEEGNLISVDGDSGNWVSDSSHSEVPFQLH